MDIEPKVSFKEATRFWAWLGCVNFGGPAGQIAIMHRELVERRHWISETHFSRALNYCMALPGPEAQQLATFIGWRLHGLAGAITAGTLFVLPAFVLLIALSWAYLEYQQAPYLSALLYGVKPAVVALILWAAVRLGRRALNTVFHAVLAGGALVAMAAFSAPFPWILVTAVIVALSVEYFDDNPCSRSTDTLITANSVRSLLKPLGFGLILWCLPFLTLWVFLGGQHALVQMALFFTKAALLTFGGTYAVLPYVHQAAVVDFGWLGHRQMIDGLALGESTPGPLVMVVIFVAFLGGASEAFMGMGSGARGMAGVAAATVVLWFTFLPSFILILAGAPLVEKASTNPRWQAPLAAISAAIVGVILHLAWVFGRVVIWPSGTLLEPDLGSVLIALASLATLALTRIGVIVVILIAASSGLVFHII